MKKFRTIEITLAAMFVALMAIGANVTSYISISEVPLSMQPFFAILAGLLLGSRLGAISMIAYALVGIAGAPVFAKFGSGIGSFVGAGGLTGGYILSFIAVAFVAGLIVEKSQSRSLATFMIAAFAGIILNYVIGTTYFVYAFNAWIGEMSHSAAWKIMIPFAVKDVIFTVIAALIAPRLYNALKNTSAYQHLQNKDVA
jgi:biotin transport system substrate-specific component